MTNLSSFPSIELFTSAVCNLDCKYCYIPKSKVMAAIHRAILEKMGKCDVNGYKDYFRNTEYLGLWGAEPTFSLNEFLDNIKEWRQIFPNVKQLNFSTNGTRLDALKRAIIACNEENINIEIQFSLDGPEYINGINRMPNLVEIITNNILELIEWLNKQELKIDVLLRTKGTITSENIKYLLHNDLVFDYIKFLRQLGDRFSNLIKNKRVRFSVPLSFNLEVPGTYSSDDGKLFAAFLRKLHSFDFDSAYTWRFERLIDFRNSLSTKPFMFTCSGGDTNFGFDFDHLHLCHRTFMLDNEEYLKDISIHKRNNWDVENLLRGTAHQIKKYFIVDFENIPKLRFLMRAYHDFWRAKIAHTFVEIRNMAYAGQVSNIYKSNDEFTELLALFLNVANSCPVENILVCGSLFVMPPSLIRLWGNGAFYELVKRTIRR